MFPKSFYLLETCKAGLSKKPRINYDQHDEGKQEARDLIVFFLDLSGSRFFSNCGNRKHFVYWFWVLIMEEEKSE